MSKLNFESAFNTIFDSISKKDFLGESLSFESARNRSLPSAPLHQDEYKIQHMIRSYFGKTGVNSSQIGTPQDFKHLEYQRERTEKHYIVTLFVDIKGSTRLSLLKPLEEVYQFKNAVIQTCIEVIRSLDGQVHRIMGDAVMAFFGGKSICKEDAIADVINCSVVLRALLENSIKPFMLQQGWEAQDIGFRVGIEFGDADEVLWAAYGYAGVSEVTATGLPIDMASKLQSQASKNDTMLGQKILNFVNWPNEYSCVKKVQRSGESTEQNIVKPNITDRNGQPIDYVMRLLDYNKCLKYIALPTNVKQELTQQAVIHNEHIGFKCSAEINGTWEDYISASRFLDKNIDLNFVITANTQVFRCPLTVKLTKINYGPDVPDDGSGKPEPKYIKQIFASKGGRNQQSPWKSISESESTSYRGLHTMQCEVFDKDNNLKYRNTIAVLIK